MTTGEFVEATTFPTEERARAAAAELLENGVGSKLERVVAEPLDAEGNATGPAETAYAVSVLDVDRPRALEVLGIEARSVPVGTDDEPAKAEKAPIPWKKIMVIWVIAMITIPTTAFFLTYYALSR